MADYDGDRREGRADFSVGQPDMKQTRLREFGQWLLLKHGHITLPLILAIPVLMNGLGHAFFNPTREVAVGVLELIASIFLFAGAFFACVRRITVALVCYGISVICPLIVVVVEVGIRIRQRSP